MVIHHANWQHLSIPGIITLFIRYFPDVTCLPSSTVIYRLQSLREGSCTVLENRSLFTVYYLPEVNEIYKVAGGSTTRIDIEKVQPNFKNKKDERISEFCTYHVGDELLIEHLNQPRFKAKVAALEDNNFQLSAVKWIDHEPNNADVTDALLKEASQHLKLPPPEDIQADLTIEEKQLIPKEPEPRKSKPRKFKPNENLLPKPTFCIYSIWGESFIEHQNIPRFKALIIRDDEIVKLEIVLWIDQEPKNPAFLDTLFNQALMFLKKNLHP